MKKELFKKAAALGASAALVASLVGPATVAFAEAESSAKATVQVGVRAEGPGGRMMPPPGATASTTLRARADMRDEESGSTTRRMMSPEDRAAMGSTSPARQEKVQERADTEIGNRIDALLKQLTRVDDMKMLSSDSKASIVAEIQAQIDALEALKIKISSDTGTTTLADAKSITTAYRTYALVMPKAAILAAADRAAALASQMDQLGAKLQTRISDAQSAGTDVSAATATMADFSAKVADAKVQASAAASAVAGLQPDNGDQTIFQSNLAVLKDAQTKIKAAQQDFVAARKDMETIRKGLPKASASATTTVSENTH